GQDGVRGGRVIVEGPRGRRGRVGAAPALRRRASRHDEGARERRAARGNGGHEAGGGVEADLAHAAQAQGLVAEHRAHRRGRLRREPARRGHRVTLQVVPRCDHDIEGGHRDLSNCVRATRICYKYGPDVHPPRSRTELERRALSSALRSAGRSSARDYGTWAGVPTHCSETWSL
ncbi:hypothetical protein T492DRAFT_914438, partial [Pavlovales sp. CCMP2436]